MRKVLSKLIAIVGGVVLMFCLLTACGDANPVGTYYFSSLKYSADGVTVEAKVGEQFMGSITLEKDFMVMELKEDGTVSFSAMGQTMAGTWKQDEEDKSKIAITIDNDTQTVTLNGSELIMENVEIGENGRVVLKK